MRQGVEGGLEQLETNGSQPKKLSATTRSGTSSTFKFDFLGGRSKR